MGIYKDKPLWEEEILIVDKGTYALGGQPEWSGTQMDGGYSNISSAMLADRTRYLKNGVEAVLGSLDEEISKVLKSANNLDDLENTTTARYNLGMGLVDNTRDIDKPISTATQNALDEKVDKVVGKQLSTEDFTTTLKNKLNGVEDNATNTDQPVNADWDSSSGLSEILNKPTLAAVATSGSYNDLTDKPSTPPGQVNSDWNASSGVEQILNKPSVISVSTMRAGTSTTEGTMTAKNIADYAAFIPLSGTSVTIDMETGRNFTLSVSDDTTINKPINLVSGQTGDMVITMEYEKVVSWNAAWNFIGGVPDIGKSASVWVVSYKVVDTNTIIASAGEIE